MNDTTEILSHLKLRLNIEHPDLEDCYIDGYESAVAELDEEANPFSAGTSEYNQWQEGWWAGFYGEEPLFTLAGKETMAETSEAEADASGAANDSDYHSVFYGNFFTTFLKITGALAATAVVGYQVLDLVA
ncbi:transmission trait enhancer LetE [Legionella dresdenensis]|uniref:Transmission trait enhancer LetE n=1 Tax=Legionella dresdenensis TaxID=450200 RepID=A0ABV8CEU7_9GAMM